jgi:C4-dicarboxylate transporter
VITKDIFSITFTCTNNHKHSGIIGLQITHYFVMKRSNKENDEDNQENEQDDQEEEEEEEEEEVQEAGEKR